MKSLYYTESTNVMWKEKMAVNYVNSYLIEANEVADATIFVSTWLRDLFIKQNIKNKNLNVILSGANSEIFNSKDQSILKQNENKISNSSLGSQLE